MSFFSNNNRNEKSVEIMQAKKNEAIFKIIILITGILTCIGMFAADLWFSYEPLVPIVGDGFAWVLAFLSTPIEVAGAMILGSKGRIQKWRENWIDFAFLIAALVIASIGDIATNWAGLMDQARVGLGREPSTLIIVAIVTFGIIMAGTEILISWFLKSIAVAQVNLRDANKWLGDYEKEHRGRRSDRRTSRNRPSRNRNRPSHGREKLERPHDMGSRPYFGTRFTDDETRYI